jgi:hypothetical protein
MQVRNGKLDVVTILGDASSTYLTEGRELIEVAGSLIKVRMENGEVGTIEVHELSYGRLVKQPGGG